MKISGRNNTCFWAVVLLLVTAMPTAAQTVWTDVKVEKQSVFIGEPVLVTISVFTSTWFTRGIDPGNIKVNGAFTTYFRPLSTNVIKQGKTYAGVQLFYHVIPYDEKDVEFPSLTIEVETPPEGEYKGVKKILTSKALLIKVKPVPPGYKKENWMVASGVTVSDHWNGNLKEAKVGDVLQRNITLRLEGNRAELIPPIEWNTIAEVSQYPSRSKVENIKNRTSISATRAETMRFLLEEEGELEIPEMVFNWYNPYQKKLYKRTLQAVSVKVLPNPDLGMLKSVRDSMNRVQQQHISDGEEGPKKVFGFTVWQIVLIAGSIFLLLIFLLKLLPKLIVRIKNKRLAYKQSEVYYFKRFLNAASTKNNADTVQALYRWVDTLLLEEPTVHCFITKYGDLSMRNELDEIEKSISSKRSVELNRKQWKKAREKYNLKSERVSVMQFDLNP